MAAAAANSQRGRMWLRMRELGEFTQRDLIAEGFPPAKVAEYVAALRRSGHVEIALELRHAASVYRLARDTGPIPPMLSQAAGAIVQRHPSARYRVWQCCRVLRRFTAAQLMMTADCGVTLAGSYIRNLKAAGYIRQIAPARCGTAGGHAVYQLTRDPGPHPLREARSGLYDPNTNEEFIP